MPAYIDTTRHGGQIVRAQISHMEEIRILVPGQVKPMIYQTYASCFLAALDINRIGHVKNCLAQYQDNVTEWDIRSWF